MTGLDVIWVVGQNRHKDTCTLRLIWKWTISWLIYCVWLCGLQYAASDLLPSYIVFLHSYGCVDLFCRLVDLGSKKHNDVFFRRKGGMWWFGSTVSGSTWQLLMSRMRNWVLGVCEPDTLYVWISEWYLDTYRRLGVAMSLSGLT